MRAGPKQKARARIMKWAAAGFAAALLLIGTAAQENPAKPAPAADQVAYRFAHGGNVAQVPMEIQGNRLLLPVAVNQSKPVLFLLASCTLHSSIDPAPWLPADVSPKSQITFKNTLLSMPDLDLGISQIEPQALDKESSIVGRQIRGIIGADILSQFVVEIEYDRSAIHFDDPKTFQYTGKGVTLPLFVRDGVPNVRAKLALRGHRPYEDEFEVRTEFNGAIEVSRPMAAAHRLKLAHVRGYNFPNVDGGRTLTAHAETLSIGPYTMTTPPVEFPDVAGSDSLAHGGAIGNLLWNKFRVILDVPHQRIILESNTSYPNNVELDTSGVAVVAKGPNLKTFEVAGVAPKSPGASAGLQKGDVIAGIDNQPAADLTLVDVRAMFAELDHEYKLTVLRGDKPLEMKMRTRHLL
ncbi:MAG: PDZ domain-containing protein [Candidatus Acidiferrales bacterium]